MLSILMMGVSIILLHERSKRPLRKNWTNRENQTFAELIDGYVEGMNVDARLGEHSMVEGMYLHAIDVDIRIPELASEAINALERLFKDVNVWSLPRVASGSGGESRHFYFVTNAPYHSKKIAHSGETFADDKGKKHWTWEIELFGTGKQVVLPPSIHSSGNQYRWEKEFDETSTLPYISGELIETLVNPEQHDDGERDVEPLILSREEIEEALSWINADHWCEDYEGWRNLGMALHHHFRGSKEGFEIWCQYSQGSAKYDLKKQKEHWKSYRDEVKRPITMRSVTKEAATNRCRAEIMDSFDSEIDPNAPKPLTRAEQRALKDEFEDIAGPLDAPKTVKACPDDPDMSILRQVRHEAPEFPLHIFTQFWRREAEALATNGAAPIDYAAATILTAAAAVIGNSRWANPLNAWKEPPVMWTQIIGPPSANKSPAIRPYMTFLNEIEASWEPQFQEDKRLWQSRKKQADAKRKQWETRMAVALEKGTDLGDMPADCIAPPEPARRRILIGDATLEALIRQMAANPRGFLNYRDEMAGWYANMSRYSGAGATDRPAWLEAYGGGIYTVDRVKDGGDPVSVRKFNVSLIGGIQPEPLLSMASSAEDGLQARFMPFWPEKTKRKLYRGELLELKGKFALEALSELKMKKDKVTGLWEPVIIPFSDEARTVFADREDDRKYREEHVPSKLENTFGKARGHVARIALILEMLKWAEDPFHESSNGPKEVSVDSVQKAIDFRENYLKHMQMRVFGFTGESEVARMAKAIAEWITFNEVEHFKAHQLRREGGIPGITSRTSKEQVEEALGYLVSLRWLRFESVKQAGRGRPSERYVVNERLWTLVNK
jgi:hypothetical protein